MSGFIHPGKTVIGTCSICGGPVCVHEHWFGTIPDTPTCQHCGAVKAENYGPVIPMAPAQPTRTTTDTHPKFTNLPSQL